jgi:hypothetical protein
MVESYADFDLLLERVAERYEVKVLSSPVGESSTRVFEPPVSDLELRNLVLELRHASEVARDTAVTAPGVALVRDVGQRLFESLFRDETLSCLHRSIDAASNRGLAGLRIRLHFDDAPDLRRLPWEMLYDRSSRTFLGLMPRTPVVRYLELAQSPDPLPHVGPLRMVVMASSPEDYPRLDVANEVEQLTAATAPLVADRRLELEVLSEATLAALHRAGQQWPFHILHFIGHGGTMRDTGEGVLVLRQATGRGRMVRGVDLGQQLASVETLRLVVLNSCQGANVGSIDPFGSTAESLVRQGLPAVVAMQFEITDHAALDFSQGLYAALADGRPVDAAVTAARLALHASADAEWATPVLYMRARDGRLFERPPTRPPEPPPEPLPGPVPPRPVANGPVPPPPEQSWTLLLALAPLCCLTLFVPFLVWAIQTRRRDLWLRTAAYGLVVLGAFIVTAPSSESQGNADPELGTLASAYYLGLFAVVVVAVADALRVRQWVGDPKRRAWARQVIADHPAAAMQWRFGRPDLTRGRPDGGLVDINRTSVRALKRYLGITGSEARRIELSRQRPGGLGGPEELVTTAGISEPTVARIEDRLLFW